MVLSDKKSAIITSSNSYSDLIRSVYQICLIELYQLNKLSYITVWHLKNWGIIDIAFYYFQVYYIMISYVYSAELSPQ